MIAVNLFIGSRYLVDRDKIRKAATQFLTDHNISHAQVDVSIVGSRKIQTLNEQKLGHAGPTDVLSFPLHDHQALNDVPLSAEIPPHLGDIVISFPESVRMARRYGKRVDDQICFYLEHGLLHLLGYHHE